jgi:aminopeptidase YwaD
LRFVWAQLSAFAIACGAPPAREPPRDPIAERAELVFSAFDLARALDTAAFADRFFRVRGNEGYQRTLDRVHEELMQGGFAPGSVRRLELGPERPAWTPRSASLSLVSGEALIRFETEADRDRACLLVRSDAMEASELELVREDAIRSASDATGRVVLGEGDPEELHARWIEGAGARGILTKNLERYHDGDDAAQFGYLPEHEGSAFGFSISERVWQRLHGVERVRVEIDVAMSRAHASAIEARIEGTDPSAGAIVFVAHADEPGANDNASGVAALAELARALRAIEAHPRRTIVFLWGQEMEVSREWLADPPLNVAAGIAVDMVGQDPAIVGAPFLIERMPDPGAVWLRPPDEHTEWGSSAVDPSAIRGHFLNDLAIASARAVERIDGPWSWRAHPFEGGSDHVPFLDRGLPALLAWHFTDRAYHTTLDRIDRVSPNEMRRVASVLGALALLLADGEIEAASIEALVRRARAERLATLAPSDGQVRDAWRAYYDGALRAVDVWY